MGLVDSWLAHEFGSRRMVTHWALLPNPPRQRKSTRRGRHRGRDRRAQPEAGLVPHRPGRKSQSGHVTAKIAEIEVEKASYALIRRRPEPRPRVAGGEIGSSR